MKDAWVMDTEVADNGFTPADMSCSFHAVEYIALDGSPCWQREGLAYLPRDSGEDDQL
jgi:hypothetical protein